MTDGANIAEILADFESRLDLYRPEGGPHGCRVLDYGEVSVVLTLEIIPGYVFKRMSGFSSPGETGDYIAAVEHYRLLLAERDIQTLDTQCFGFATPSHVVYLVQPLIEKGRIGNSIIRDAHDEDMAAAVTRVIDRIAASLRFNRTVSDGVEAAADSQMSNWYFPPDGDEPILIDIGSAILRVKGSIQAYCEPLYRSFPWPLGSIVRLMKVVEKYYDHYFDLRLAVLDILGNFIKEQAVHRLDTGIGIVNGWIANLPADEELAPFTAAEVRQFYRSDAATLELMLQVRRFTRFVRNGIFRQRYDYIMPGRIKRY